MRRARPDTAVLVAIALLVAGLAVVPLVQLVARAFTVDGHASLENFRRAYTNFDVAELVSNSFVFALGSTAVAVAIGTALAFLLARTDVPLRRLLTSAALVPLLIPGVLHTVAWILLAGPRSGWLNHVLEPVFGPGTLDVFSMTGMVVVEGLHLSPLAFLLMAAAFRSLDPALEEAALVAGAGWRTVLRRVTLPPLRPAFVAASLVLLVRGLESFEVPALLGIPDRTWVFSSRVWRALNAFPPRWGEAGALALSLLALTSLGIFLHSRLAERGGAYQTVRGRAYRPRRIPLGRWRGVALAAVLAYYAVAVVLPLAILLYASLQSFYLPPSMDRLSDLTLGHFADHLTDATTLRAFRHSLVLGAGAATVCVAMGAVISWFVVRSRVRGRWLLDNMATLPLAIPGLVLGVALLFVYLRSPIPVYGTLWLLLLAYVTRYLPYGVRYASVSMFQIGSELEEAARTSGATWGQAFRRVVLPLAVPGLAAGWIYVLALSIRELSSSILLYAPGGEVIAVRIWSLYDNAQFPELAALGIILVVLVLALGAASFRLSGRFGIPDA